MAGIFHFHVSFRGSNAKLDIYVPRTHCTFHDIFHEGVFATAWDFPKILDLHQMLGKKQTYSPNGVFVVIYHGTTRAKSRNKQTQDEFCG